MVFLQKWLMTNYRRIAGMLSLWSSINLLRSATTTLKQEKPKGNDQQHYPFRIPAGIIIKYRKQEEGYYVYTDNPADIVGCGITLDQASEDFRTLYNQYLEKQGSIYRLVF